MLSSAGTPKRERKAVVARAAVDIQAVRAFAPQTVVRDLGDGADDGGGAIETHQAQLAAVSMARQYEVGFTSGQVFEGARVVK